MARRDRRRKTEAAKARTASARIARAAARRRVTTWSSAASAAEAAGHPLNAALHVTWSALEGGERRHGHVLGLEPVERERRLWSALRLVATRARVPWLAARAPEYDQRRALHLHLALHLPDTGAFRDVIEVLERLTGAPAERVDMRGWSYRGGGRTHRGIVAWSGCRGWLLQRRVETLGGSSVDLAAYAAKGDGKAAVEGQHRLSNELSALTRASAATAA